MGRYQKPGSQLSTNAFRCLDPLKPYLHTMPAVAEVGFSGGVMGSIRTSFALLEGLGYRMRTPEGYLVLPSDGIGKEKPTEPNAEQIILINDSEHEAAIDILDFYVGIFQIPEAMIDHLHRTFPLLSNLPFEDFEKSNALVLKKLEQQKQIEAQMASLRKQDESGCATQ